MNSVAVLFLAFAAFAAAAPARELKFGAPAPDIDECMTLNGGCTHCCTNYDYLVFEYSYKCSCPEGYVLGLDEHTCEKVDACPTHGCSHGCTESAFSGECLPADDPVCSCPGCETPGLTGDGHVLGADSKTCFDVNECADGANGGCSHICVNTPGCFYCECPGCSTPGLSGDGYLLSANGKICQDINECAVGNGGCSHTCVNTDGCYYCECPGCTTPGLIGDGYLLANDGHTCADINECAVGNGGCSQICVNTPGCFYCECEGCTTPGLTGDGYELLANGRTCADINECAVGNGGCSHTCVNTPGCFYCDCPGCETPGLTGDGYVLAANGRTCQDVNECAVGNGGCSHTCVNTPGCYFCECPGCQTPGSLGDGYTLAANGRTCMDINECAVGNGGCSHFCVNTPGCYHCECPPGCDDPALPQPAGGYYVAGDGLTCVDVDECSDSGWSGVCRGPCENTPGCYECISADVETDYKMSLTLIMHDYLVGYMNENVFVQMVADEIGIGREYVQVDSVVQAGADTEVSFTWFAIDAQGFVTLLLHVEDIDWESFLIDYMILTLPSSGGD